MNLLSESSARSLRSTTPSPAKRFVIASVVLVILGLCLPTLLQADDATMRWASFRGDSQLTGKAPGTLPDSLQPLWTVEDEDGFEATAAIDNRAVLIGSMGGRFRALDLATGSQIWEFTAGAEIKSSALVDGNRVFFGDEAGTMYALDRRDGTELWQFETEGGITSSPNMAGPCLLFGSYDNSLYCLDPASGEKRWSLETEGYVNATPAVWRGQAISAGCDGLLRLVDLESGSESRNIELGGYVGASAAIHGNMAFVGNFENQVLGLDLEEGTVAWVYDPPDASFPFYSSAATDGQRVVLGGRDKRVHSLDPGTGEAIPGAPSSERAGAEASTASEGRLKRASKPSSRYRIMRPSRMIPIPGMLWMATISEGGLRISVTARRPFRKNATSGAVCSL